jgi:hypothetical protein
MNELKKEEKVFSVILRLVVICVLALGAVFFTSCEPAPCEDCYTYTYSDGSTEWMCVEYSCDSNY